MGDWLVALGRFARRGFSAGPSMTVTDGSITGAAVSFGCVGLGAGVAAGDEVEGTGGATATLLCRGPQKSRLRKGL